MIKVFLIVVTFTICLSQYPLKSWKKTPDIQGMNVIFSSFDGATPYSSGTVTQNYQEAFKALPTVVTGFMNFAVQIGVNVVYYNIIILTITKNNVQLQLQISSDFTNKMIHASIIAFNMSNLTGIQISNPTSIYSNGSSYNTLTFTTNNYTVRIIINKLYMKTSQRVYFSIGYGISISGSNRQIYNMFSFTNDSTERQLSFVNIVIQRTLLGSRGIEMDYSYAYGSSGYNYITSFRTKTESSIISLGQTDTNITVGFNVSFNPNSDTYLETINYYGNWSYYQFLITNFRIFNCTHPLYYYEANNPLSCYQTCPNRTYHNQTICSPCSYSCKTCLNNLTCTDCDSVKNRIMNTLNNTCKCMNGYYQSWSYLYQYCYSCINNCSTCFEYYSCSTCNSTKNLTLDSTSGRYCYCLSNLYVSRNSYCDLCSDIISGCITCSSSSVCTSCYTDNNFMMNTNNRCVCINNSYAVNTTTNCSLCGDLMVGCLTCSSRTSCLTCSTAGFILNASYLCQCNGASNYTAKGSLCVLCSSQLLGCLNCSNISTCTVCNQAAYFILSSGTCICKDGHYLSAGVCLPCHYSCRQCSGQAQTNCISCDSLVLRSISGTRCPCNLGSYDNGVSLCASCMVTCLGCNNGNTCYSCDSNKNYTLINNQCQCITNYHFKPDYSCIYCPDLIANCLSCANYTNCNSCISPNYTFTNPSITTQCNCNTNQQYFSSSIVNNCINCSDLINGCTLCLSNISCSSCHPVNFTLTTDQTTCLCSETQQYFPHYNNCTFCYDLIFGCLDCQSNSTCIICDQPGFFKKVGDRCQCIDGYFLSQKICKPCKPSCLTCVGTMDNCISCSHDNLRFLQGSNCLCITPFDDCMQSTLQGCSPPQCSYLKTPHIQINSMIKDPTKNSLTFKITISPITPYLDTVDFSSIFNIGLPIGTNISYQYLNGIITAQVDYHQDLQQYLTNITLKLKQLDPWYFDLTPDSVLNYSVSPTNNLASNNYSSDIYQQRQMLTNVVLIVVSIGFIVYAIGLFSSRIVSSEMLSTIQISYLGLFIVNNHDPLIQPLKNLKYTSGLNNLFETSQNSAPNRVYWAGYTSEVLSNFNLMLLLMLIPLTLSLLFYILFRKSTKWRFISDKLWKLMLGQGMLTATLFSIYNFSCSLGIFIVYGTPSDKYFYLSIFQILIYGGLFGFSMWALLTKDKVWMGEYKTMFNWNVLSQKYYLIPIGQRILVGLLLSTVNFSFASGIISILVIIAYIVVTAYKKPFVKKYHDYRSIAHCSIAVIILSLYVLLSATGPSKKQGPLTYIPYGVIILVILNILIGLVFIVKGFLVLKKQGKRQQDSVKIEDQQINMRRQMQKKAIQMFKQSKSNNVKNKLLMKQRVVKLSKDLDYQSVAPRKDL